MKNLKLFANCIPTKGFRISIMTDLQFGKIIPIPNSLLYLLKKYDGLSLKEILLDQPTKYHDTIKEYYQFLLEKGLVFACDRNEIEFFPELPLDWDFPAQITNAVVEYKSSLFSKIVRQLDNLNCKAVNVIIENSDYNKIKSILDILQKTSIYRFELHINKIDYSTLDELIDLFNKYNRIQNVFIFNSAKSQVIIQKSYNIYIMREKYSHSSCGNISHHNFSINIPFFTEAQKHNTCLNRKISVDVNGDIKNCPSMKKSYGNIKNTNLKEAIEKPGFKDLWYINKDKIDVCKDCEFRYMCTDCRAFIKDPDNIYSQPAKCNYNPYIAKWKGQEGYITVEEWRKQNTDWEEKAKKGRKNYQKKSYNKYNS